MFPEPNGTKFWSHSFHLQNSGTLQTRMDQRGTPWKWILTIFKYKNEYHKQLKNRWKNGVIWLVSFFPSWVMVINVSSIVLSTALRAPGSRECATDLPPFWSHYFAPGWVSSVFVWKISCHTKYQEKLGLSKAKNRSAISPLHLWNKDRFFVLTEYWSIISLEWSITHPVWLLLMFS